MRVPRGIVYSSVRMRLSACVVVLSMCGCKDGDRPATKGESTDPLVRIEALKPKLARARQLAFKTDVSASYQSTTDFRDYMRRSAKKEQQRLKERSNALVALGLLPSDTDFASAIEHAYATQAAAYYDPDVKRFYFVMAPTNIMMLDVVSAHELTHALQDQHFGLTTYFAGADTSDALTARRFVVEGDAMLSSMACLIYDKTNLAELTSDQISAMRPKLEEIANAAPSNMATMLRQQASASRSMDKDLEKSLDALDSIPHTILVPLMDAYMKGAILVLDAYERGGWASVNALYDRPPESTEQVLHPNERFLAAVDHPRHVTLPQLNNYTLIDSDVLGELQWGVYFSLWKHDGGDSIQQNWDGDRYAVLRSKDGSLISLVATIWDGEYDAKQFYDAYASSIVTRYAGERRTEGDDTIVEHDGVATWVIRERERVYIVDGAVDNGVVEALIDGTTFE